MAITLGIDQGLVMTGLVSLRLVMAGPVIQPAAASGRR